MAQQNDNLPFRIKRIDITCRIVDVEIEDKNYQLDFDVEGSDVLITNESMNKVTTKSKKWWLANEIEKYIRTDPRFVHSAC